MFSARDQRRHLEILASEAGAVGPREPAGRVEGPHPTSLRALVPLPVLNLGAASEDLMGTKCKPFIWANVPTLQMRKLRPYEVKGCACQHHSARP